MKIKSHSVILLLLLLSGIMAIHSARAQSDPYDRDTAFIGIMSRLFYATHSTDSRIATEMTFIEFMKNIDKACEFTNFDDPLNVVTQMRKDNLDAILANPVDYLKIEQQIDEDHHYSLLFGDRLKQRVILLVRKSDNINSLSQLANKTLAFPYGHHLGKMFLDMSLLERNLPQATDHFSEIQNIESLNDAIINLFFNKVDSALVTDVAFELAQELNPQIRHSVVPLIVSEPMIQIVIGINKRVPSSFKQRVDQMASNLDQYPRTLHLLSMFKSKRVIKISASELEKIRKIVWKYESLSKKQRNKIDDASERL
ncbi:MAG: phosphate/phosphite/phosphonate ABC transporter substrate-binding protein [Candidatus Thiodiazotropha lotti]|uniref:Phosphate/phosphite/phosphonate ABC transporter substrate-binding protein n=1 Tax=Candidatus Thiodiazotropha lotti TaxID=2792787 RepID=A0A9E4MZU1_9GAMM|nr:phosphate/phosphite/phosphonate ABC transporter substrate-binding protein [Candidatus Thiodiazotropha lotti]MCG7938105.1 phosphate/phosphite/phosphonate ABC transporter substrate-binding protein [Candidatus Thiodiazotropha lotti]MCW4202572.1 phosphate/phosphite/phosphonate ABC transporter substrate-binding protein [Candidatus Thiodiazotropha lotti]